MLRWGYRVPFLSAPPLSAEPIPFPSYGPNSIRGLALEKEVQSLVQKGDVELAPLPSPGFYSRLFVVMKASRLWRPVIELSILNVRVCKTPFKIETLQSVLLSVQSGDWVVSIGLKDACLQIPIHPDSRKYLRFVAFESSLSIQGSLFQPLHGSAGFHTGHGSGIGFSPSSRDSHFSLLRRLTDSSFFSSLSPSSLGHGFTSLSGTRDSGQMGEIQSPPSPASSLSRCNYRLHSFQGFSLPSESREAFLNHRRISVLRRSASLSSLTQLVPEGRLRMRSLQIRLHHLWDRKDDLLLIPWDSACRQVLEWWLVPGRLQLGISLAQVNPCLGRGLGSSPSGQHRFRPVVSGGSDSGYKR